MEESLECSAKKQKISDQPPIIIPNTEDPTSPPKISKRALKKQAKAQKWEDSRQDRIEKRKSRRSKKQTRRAELQALISTKTANGEDVSELLPQLKIGRQDRFSKEEKATLHAKLELAPKVIIDCDFESHMKETELNSLCTQFAHFLSVNKKSEKPLQTTVDEMVGSICWYQRG